MYTNITYIHKDDFQFQGEINKFVYEQFKNGNKKGIISSLGLKDEKINKLKKLIIKIPQINWIYISSSEILIFTLRPYKIKEEVNLKDIIKKISEIISFEYNDYIVYPVKNVLNEFFPKYKKDIKIKNNEWNVGKFGKKKFRKKWDNFRKKLFKV